MPTDEPSLEQRRATARAALAIAEVEAVERLARKLSRKLENLRIDHAERYRAAREGDEQFWREHCLGRGLPLDYTFDDVIA